MYVLGLIAVGGIVLAGGFGIVSLSAFNAKLEKDLAEVRQGVYTLVDIQSASIDFNPDCPLAMLSQSGDDRRS